MSTVPAGERVDCHNPSVLSVQSLGAVDGSKEDRTALIDLSRATEGRSHTYHQLGEGTEPWSSQAKVWVESQDEGKAMIRCNNLSTECGGVVRYIASDERVSHGLTLDLSNCDKRPKKFLVTAQQLKTSALSRELADAMPGPAEPEGQDEAAFTKPMFVCNDDLIPIHDINAFHDTGAPWPLMRESTAKKIGFRRDQNSVDDENRGSEYKYGGFRPLYCGNAAHHGPLTSLGFHRVRPLSPQPDHLWQLLLVIVQVVPDHEFPMENVNLIIGRNVIRKNALLQQS